MEVFAPVMAGMLNKQIAWHLGVGEKTVKVHRARVKETMRAGSLAELVRLADRGRDLDEHLTGGPGRVAPASVGAGPRSTTARPTSPGQWLGPAMALIAILDDDRSVLRALRLLLQTAGYRVETFASAGELLRSLPACGAGCLGAFRPSA